MDNDNEHEDDGASRSVFGDEPDLGSRSVFGDSDELPEASSVFSDAGDELPDSSSVFGDAIDLPESSSVFGDAEPELPLGGIDSDEPDLDAPDVGGFGDKVGDATEALEAADIPDLPEDPGLDTVIIGDADGPSNSVFGDSGSTSSVFGDAGDDPSSLDIDDEPKTASLDDWTTPAANDSVSISEDTPTGEAIALDVEPGDEDDLEAWSDLSASAPSWGEGESAPQPEAWDPGPAPAPDEPAMVQIGADSGERFFTYDDQNEFAAEDFGEEIGTGSDMQSRIITGVALLGIAIVALTIGPLLALLLIVVIVALSAGEFYNALRVAGYQPATLLGLAASISLPLAVYFRGTQAVALVMALSVIFGLLWFLSGVSTEMPVMNLGVTLLGVAYIGVLGSFGAASLEIANRWGINGDDGTGLLLAAIIVTVGYDVGAFFAGRSFGRTPLAAVSPNKTVEGLIGGAIASFVASIVFMGVLRDLMEPFESLGGYREAAILGLIGAVVAPLGDLSESLLKRDLGIKDMGSILPGHGGFLDRFDALLFVLPAVFYFAEAVFYKV